VVFAQTYPTNSNGTVKGAVTSYVLGALIVALVIWTVGYIFKKQRMMYNDVHEIKDVLITPKPTSLVPNPPKGLIDVVSAHTHALAILLKGTEALIVD
ncbi:MAG: hypothetical protein ACYCPT_12700, partial [Acidimicrobiales bacterium]